MTQPSAYANDHSAGVLRTHSWRTAANSAGYLIPHLSPDLTILDVGCGPGSISVDLARIVSRGHVTAIDYVEDPLEDARAAAASAGVTNITFSVGNIHALPFADDTFDVVHAHQVLQHVADPVAALREMRRVVKPGGLVACRESASMMWYPESEKLQAGHELISRIATAKGGNPHPGSRIHVWARDAGFDLGRVTRSTGSWCFSSDEERKYWGGSMAARMRGSGLTKNVLDAGLATQDELEHIASGWDDFCQDELAWFAVVHGEILCRK